MASRGSQSLKDELRALKYVGRTLQLVWSTNRLLTLAMSVAAVVGGVLPACIAYVAALIVDTVAEAVRSGTSEARTTHALLLVLVEGSLVAATVGVQRVKSMCRLLMRAHLSQRVQEMIIAKALTLELSQFESPVLHDRMTQASRGAGQRPLSLVDRTFGLVQDGMSVASFGVLVATFSPWALVLLLAVGAPVFLAEAKFSGDAFRLFKSRMPETRMQGYLAAILTREDFAKEILLSGIGQPLLERHKRIFRKLYREDGRLVIRRDVTGMLFGILGASVLYGVYVWVVLATLAATITIGQMAMYFMAFRQGQSTVSTALLSLSGMYEDNLYISTLYDFLATPDNRKKDGVLQGSVPGDGIRFENVSFTYPDANRPVLIDVNLHIESGKSLALVGTNGSGKTTLIKLLSGLYRPTQGRMLLDGADIRDWDETALRRRIGVVFQDFVHYQLLLGENIGAGDAPRFEDEAGWREAGEKVRLDALLKNLPGGYRTQLGRWFNEGQELSGGQWQRIALARAMMRKEADILILDEPTAAMDVRAEAEIFGHFHTLAQGRTAILISHRLSTTRMADRIAVLESGRIIELGSHEELMHRQGHYSELFELQASAYR